MWKGDKGLALSALSALLALGCGGEAVDLGRNGEWTDAPTSSPDTTTPQTIYRGAEPILGFALEGPTLYLLIQAQQTVDLVACPLTRCGSERTTLLRGLQVSHGLALPTKLVVAGGLLYWVHLSPSGGQLVACPTTGCPEPQVVTSDVFGSLTADEDGVYWFDFAHNLFHGGLNAPAPTALGNVGLDVDSSSLTAWGEHLYFVASDNDSSSVRRVRKDGTSASEVVATDRAISGFSLGQDSLFYVSRILTGRVAQCSPEGCSAGTSTLADNQRWPGTVRVEGNEVFWLNHTPWDYVKSKATLMSCLLPECATPKTRLVEFPMSDPEGQNFAVNQDSIVWLEGAPGAGFQLQRLAR